MEDETDEMSWHLLWVAAVVLLRSVGHVMEKVDVAGDASLHTPAQAAYRRWKNPEAAEHRIFRDFIEEERNLIIKEYAHRISRGPVTLVSGSAATESERQPPETFLARGNLFRPMLAGSYMGEDGRDVGDEAIAWWKRERGAIERAAG